MSPVSAGILAAADPGALCIPATITDGGRVMAARTRCWPASPSPVGFTDDGEPICADEPSG